MSVEKGLQSLMEEALKEGRSDIFKAISQFLTIPVICKAIESSPQLSGDATNQALTKTFYSSEDSEALFKSELLEIESHREFLSKMHLIDGLEEDSRLILFEEMAEKIFHLQAIEMYRSAKDGKAFISAYKNSAINRYRRGNGNSFFSMFGNPGKWNSDTFKLLSILDMEIPDIFTQYNPYTANEAWTAERFDLQVNKLGAEMDKRGISAPMAAVVNGELVFSTGIELVESFRREFYRLNTPDRTGGWNSLNFPKYLPFIVDSHNAESLESVGAIQVEQAGVIEMNGKKLITHGYKDHSCKVDYVDVAMAMTLLSKDKVTEMLSDKDLRVALIPAEKIAEHTLKEDQLLTLEMRAHRPEVIRAILTEKDQNGLCEYSIYHKLFVRGIPAGTSRIEETQLYGFSDAAIISSNEGINFLRIGLATEGVNRLVFSDGETADSLISKVKIISNKIGFTPNVSIRANRKLLIELSELDIPFKITQIFSTDRRHFIANEDKIFDEHRLCAKIGLHAEKLAQEYGGTPSELITKAIRIKNNEDVVQTILGMLDRYPLKTVAESAKTEKQIEFLINHFDFAPIMADLSESARRKFGRKSLENDFNL